MIRLHKTDGNEILLNDQLIKNIQRGHDHTTLILEDDSRIEVKNSYLDIVTKIKAANFGSKQDDAT